jgi:release factor glutamine methyltransferase
VTVLEVIQRSTDFLVKKNVDSPRLQAELLLAHVLKLPRMQLYLNFERVLSPAEEDSLRQLIKRRGQREPLQYILGSTSFCGLEIRVDRRVLIPRPETELLAEQGWTFLIERLSPPASDSGYPCPSSHDEPEDSSAKGTVRALDFGTGSGCLAIALAVNCPAANIVAVDVSAEALALAQENATHQGVAERVAFMLGNGLATLSRDMDFDLLIANPPYIPSSEIDSLQPEVRDYDPRLALDGGPDGLEFYRHLASEGICLVKIGGKLMLELGDGQQASVTNIFQNENWIVERVVKDYSHQPRILIARRPA